MRIHNIPIFALLLTVIFISCGKKDSAPDPWGANNSSDVSVPASSLQLEDIISNGELIMVTISGPDTYYEYHGRGMGLHYLLLQDFCQHIGVSLRVDVCKDTSDMENRLKSGEADVLAMPMKDKADDLAECLSNASGNKWHWLVNQSNTSLADTLNHYFTADVIKKVEAEQSFWLSSASITRKVYSPMLNRSKGIISEYDYLFMKYASVAGWDWHLLAAQCYQESTFDPRAHSWAGACGLMQIMPSTASHLGLAQSDIYNPERNIAAATKYIAELTGRFKDITNPSEKMKFVLASYNGGSNHVRDAMALARKYGRSPYLWDNVSEFILKLQSPAFYNDPVVKSGYMRGSETADYVARIWNRWMDYRGVKGGTMPVPSKTQSQSTSVQTPSAPGVPAPHPSAKRKAKYQL